MSEPPVQSPEILKSLSIEDLRYLAEDVRQAILSACMTNGGHLGASLGAVDLAIALHRTFESPREPIIWDVGHQAYAHKLLTGRWKQFHTLRTTGGISGFLAREESEHDVFGAGHSSTSLSAALAAAWARRKNQTEWTVAVIGDGGLTAGLAFEALNNVRSAELGPLLIVVNDNQMSIAANVGALSHIFATGEASQFFNLFGFEYLGPVDGHDLPLLIGTLEGIRAQYSGRPVVLHVLTQKGKGYPPAEEQPSAFHGISPVQAKVPGVKQPPSPKKTYSETLGEAVGELARKNEAVVAISAAMPEGTGLLSFSQEYPERFFDVGISEAHATTFAAGLASQGKRPILAVYSTFLQRALDSIIHDVALQKLPVIFAIDRAGLVGADGPTHHGVFDLVYLGMIPGMTVLAPEVLADLPDLLEQALQIDGPVAIRYPRGSAPAEALTKAVNHIRWHQKPVRPKAIAVALGSSAPRLQEAFRMLQCPREELTLLSCLKAKPVPQELISYLNEHRHAPLLVVEDGVLHGGFGQVLVSQLNPRSSRPVLKGYGDHFTPHGSVSDLEKMEQVSAADLKAALESLLSETEPREEA